MKSNLFVKLLKPLLAFFLPFCIFGFLVYWDKAEEYDRAWRMNSSSTAIWQASKEETDEMLYEACIGGTLAGLIVLGIERASGPLLRPLLRWWKEPLEEKKKNGN
jgi:hypothetical protein